MSIQPVKTSGTAGIPIFQVIDNTLRGGAVLTGQADGAVIEAGTVLAVDEATREATVAVAGADSGATGLLLRDVTFVEDGENIVDVVIVGIVYENRIPEVDADHKADLPRITFSKSF